MILVTTTLLLWVGVHGSLSEESCPRDAHTDCNQISFATCGYEIRPPTKVFGAEVVDINLASLNQSCADALRQEAYMHRFLLFRNQTLTWREQLTFTNQLGPAFQETSSLRRGYHPKTPDPHIAVFYNDPVEGIPGQGVEGWHVDGNSVSTPHQFTLIYCVNATRNGPTLVVPLKEMVAMFSQEDLDYLQSILFVSGFNESISMPLIYKHPVRNDDTIMLALNGLSGQYVRRLSDQDITLSKDDANDPGHVISKDSWFESHLFPSI